MCLYPRIIRNRKYVINKKNEGNVPEIKDKRTEYVPIGCGKCIECMKQKAREWKVRLYEEIKSNSSGKFVTLTFSDEALSSIKTDELDISKKDNAIATKAVRLFLERWRKKYKKSLKHWLITELGHNGTERLHLHGILWTDEIDDIKKIWQYGYVYIGQYVNEQTINYIAKYVTKLDTAHKWFNGKILTSAGIGKDYLNTYASKKNAYNEKETNELYKDLKGGKLPLPIYYRNKIYTDNQRESLWIKKLDKNERYICGEKLSMADDINEERYWKTLHYYRQVNRRLGYGSIAWNKEIYEKSLKKLKKS